jgi:hypothetical protein
LFFELFKQQTGFRVGFGSVNVAGVIAWILRVTWRFGLSKTGSVS